MYFTHHYWLHQVFWYYIFGSYDSSTTMFSIYRLYSCYYWGKFCALEAVVAGDNTDVDGAGIIITCNALNCFNRSTALGRIIGCCCVQLPYILVRVLKIWGYWLNPGCTLCKPGGNKGALSLVLFALSVISISSKIIPKDQTEKEWVMDWSMTLPDCAVCLCLATVLTVTLKRIVLGLLCHTREQLWSHIGCMSKKSQYICHCEWQNSSMLNATNSWLPGVPTMVVEPSGSPTSMILATPKSAICKEATLLLCELWYFTKIFSL